MPQPLVTRSRNFVLVWLIICLLLVGLMVLVGGYTRLSGSGLSITEWKPIHGIIPPLNEKQWQEEFTAYQSTPQYNLVNSDMSLAGFREIFWPEYFHRLLARSIGIIFFLPLLIFAAGRSISKKFFWRMAGIFALGGLQGAMGWIMVKSGLQDAPYVNHVKLTLHLSLAFIIFALILWAFLDILNRHPSSVIPHPSSIIPTYKLWLFLLALQIIFGGLMAGSHAGLIYNTWPDMNGQYLPDELAQSFITNPLENITFIQFIHRTLAIIVTVIFLLWCYFYRNYIKSSSVIKECTIILLIILAQFALGVLTLLNHVPLPLALLHQITALFLWLVAIALLHKLVYKVA